MATTNTPHGNHKHTHTVTQSHTHIESGLLMLLPTHVDSNAMDEWVAAAAVDQNFLSLSNLHVLDSNSKHCFIIATRPKDSTLTHKRRVRSRPQQVQHNFGTVSQSCMPHLMAVAIDTPLFSVKTATVRRGLSSYPAHCKAKTQIECIAQCTASGSDVTGVVNLRAHGLPKRCFQRRVPNAQ